MSNIPLSQTASRALYFIAGHKLAEKGEKLLKSHGIPLCYAINGVGTATSEMMDLLGLGTAEKTILVALLPKDVANHILACLKDILEEVERKNRGIAFTLPMTGANQVLLQLFGVMNETYHSEEERKEEVTVTEKQYALITAIVNPGYSEEVMNAARAAGARGGTVIHTRQANSEKAQTVLGLDVQEEREMILIVSDSEHKLQIMQAIGNQYGLHSEAKGLVFSTPIDTAIGLS